MTSFPSSFLGQEGTDSAQDSPPVVFTLSQEQASGASSGCGVLQRTATAAAGGGHRAASQLLPLLEPRPPWPPACPCELAAHSDGGRAPTQRVAFIFSHFLVRSAEGGQGREREDRLPASQWAAAETSFADTEGRGNGSAWGSRLTTRSTAQPAFRHSRRPAFP